MREEAGRSPRRTSEPQASRTHTSTHEVTGEHGGEVGMCREGALEVQLPSDRHGAISGVFMLETTPGHLSDSPGSPSPERQ